MKEQIKDDKQYYIFLDEVQNVNEFQKAVDGIYIIKNADVYITGSNAYLLSGELATLLTGRYIEIKMYPLSFKEYVEYYNKRVDEHIYLDYINKSSFPYALKLEDESEIDDYLDALYNTIILKDIAQRKKIADTPMLRTLSKFMFDNIGNCLSIKKIADTLTSDGRGISVHTVENYLDSLVECYIFNKVPRFDIKGKQYLQSGEKEIDFVAENKEGFTYFQVAYTTREKSTLEKELAPLQGINDHYPKYILTMDIDPVADFNGIKKMNVLDWLIDK